MSDAAFDRIESKRLILRRFRDTDLAPFVAYRNDPEVARYQSWDSFDEREARAFIREVGSAQPGVAGDWFQFAIESKEVGSLVGDCALQVDGQEPYRAELGFRLGSRLAPAGLRFRRPGTSPGRRYRGLQERAFLEVARAGRSTPGRTLPREPLVQGRVVRRVPVRRSERRMAREADELALPSPLERLLLAGRTCGEIRKARHGRTRRRIQRAVDLVVLVVDLGALRIGLGDFLSQFHHGGRFVYVGVSV